MAGNNLYEAGEFADDAEIEKFLTTAIVAKGAILTVTPAATPTVATCANADSSGNGPYAVAIEAAASGAYVRAVTKGRVAVTADGSCYRGALVYGKNGKAVARDLTSWTPGTNAELLGRVTVGGATTKIVTVDVGRTV